MRKSFLLYLFVFAALLAIFQYVNAEKMLKTKNEALKSSEEELNLMQEKYDSLVTRSSSSEEFTLASNEEAITYLENRGFTVDKVTQLLQDQIISRNKASADNDLVPYEGMEGFFRINNIKILNHKWIIADFTDGSYWGELLISYNFDQNNNLILETENALLYPKNG